MKILNKILVHINKFLLRDTRDHLNSDDNLFTENLISALIAVVIIALPFLIYIYEIIP